MTKLVYAKLNTRLLTITALVCSLLILSSCSDRKLPSDLPDTHPATWTDPASKDFHGEAISSIGIKGCVKCHGLDFDGGEVEVSCIECHQELDVCASCHGGQDNNSGAPPIGLDGETKTTALAVGAHTAHLTGSELAGPIDCDFCHVVPISMFDSSHYDGYLSPDDVDSIAEIVWSGFADPGQANWYRSNATCTNTYCHGQFPGGDSTNIPVWTDSLAECGSCHPFDQTEDLRAPHDFHINTVGLKCADCHASVIDSNFVIIQPILHVNGIVETLTADADKCTACHTGGAGSCTNCHGGQDNNSGAPPTGLRGEISTTDIAVGAHTTHLIGKEQSAGYLCTTCHISPVLINDDGHLGLDSIAELTWSSLAGESSVWDSTSATCEDTYCHGNFSGGNNTNKPIWTGVDQAACGTCHDDGSNPSTLGGEHNIHVNLANLSCGECHAEVIDTLSIFIDKSLHANGTIDILTRDEAVCQPCHGAGGSTCTLCHGGQDNNSGAPPEGLRGETSTTQRAVGAHTTHLSGKDISDGYACTTCHRYPVVVNAGGHLGSDSIAEITWSSLAGPNPSWNRSNATCEDTYCHGNFANGNQSNQPIWTGNDQADCGSCHDDGSTPSELGWKHNYHVGQANLSCGECHASVIDTLLIFTDKSLHVNGDIDTLTRDETVCQTCHGNQGSSCTLCHGGLDNQTSAPPRGLFGITSTDSIGVGAHTAHVEGGTIASAIDCSTCHIVPLEEGESQHQETNWDGIAEITWSGLSNKSSTPVWDRNSAACSDTYCHGKFPGGYNSNAPVWTGTDQATCGSCHAVSSDYDDLGDEHKKHVDEKGVVCSDCHYGTVNNALEIVDLSLHIDGVNDVIFSDTITAIYNGVKCTNNNCHEDKNW